MGIKGISKIIKKYGTERVLDFYSTKKIAIDTSIFLHKFKYSTGTNSNKFLNRFLYQIKLFKSNNITPIYVFEGSYPIEKQITIDNRKKIYEKKINEINSIICEKDKNNKKKNLIKITSDDITDLKELFISNNIEYIEADTEGEKYCAYLNKIDKVDVVLSNDYDTLTFGCKNLLTNINGKYIEYCLDDILQDLNITYDIYVDICISCGCDYYPKGIKNLGPINSLKLAKKYGNIEFWPNIIIPDKISRMREIFKS